ncbi:hypothetical protein SAMN05216188_106271 [Lentzea xinjiangensis]|uniref:DUF2188 domain-containing protein n=1 Tax=Lentzea xinjiangensis TaxID=402600 RepID=A0A1H9K2X3_9PSEU|nr:DUF2188 domain-containing protein [Lentzea xinjiangensis]SEQ93464.1 hypothetical protein SAMN05216188_106271 [Lentzea xinjiangensis]
MQGDVETYHENGTWKNKVEGNSQASSTHDTKDEAVARGREMAVDRGVEHIIRNMDGTISEKNTYPRSSDPRDIPG